MKSLFFISILTLGILKVQAFDQITLKNQMKFEGKIVEIQETAVEFLTNGTSYVIPQSEIEYIQFDAEQNEALITFLTNSINDENKCLNGQLDAENFHGKKGGHFILGMAFGPFAIIGTAISNPTPDRGKRTYLMSENKADFNDLEYISCYKKQAKRQLITMEALGWATWILIALI